MKVKWTPLQNNDVQSINLVIEEIINSIEKSLSSLISAPGAAASATTQKIKKIIQPPDLNDQNIYGVSPASGITESIDTPKIDPERPIYKIADWGNIGLYFNFEPNSEGLILKQNEIFRSILPTEFESTIFYKKPFAGTGVHGDVVISSNTNWSGIVECENLTIDSGVYLAPAAGQRELIILVRGRLIINGYIYANECGALGGNQEAKGGVGGCWGGGGGGCSNIKGGGGGGGWGMAGENGDASLGGAGGGSALKNYPHYWGGFVLSCGGDGGWGTNGYPGELLTYGTLVSPISYQEARILYGAGGGAGIGTNFGSGGRGGGIIWIEANEIIWGPSARVWAKGGNGRNGGSNSSGGGGGGGGFIQIFYKNKTGISNISVSGGTGGDGSGGVYKNGGNGSNGIYGEFQI